MAGYGAVRNFSGPFPDGDGIYDLTTRVPKDTRVLRTADAALVFSQPEICSGDQSNSSLLATISCSFSWIARRQGFGRKAVFNLGHPLHWLLRFPRA